MSLPAIFSLLLKFNAEEILQLFPCVFGIEEDEIKKHIKKYLLSFRAKNVAQIGLNIYEQKRPTKEELLKLELKLKLYEAAIKEINTWKCVNLLEKDHETPDDLAKEIRSCYRRQARDAIVFTYDMDDIQYVLTSEKKITKNGMKHGKPIIFALDKLSDEPYIFYTCKMSDPKEFLDLFCLSLGFTSYREVRLSGKNVASLFGMIRRKFGAEEALAIPYYNPRQPVNRGPLLDFTQTRDREKYARAILPGYTKLNKFTVHAENEWRGAVIPEMEGEKFITELEFVSNDPKVTVEDMFREMIKSGIVQVPVPSYISNMANVNKNVVSLKPQRSEDSD